MSIATEIQRLQTAKADIKTAIENKGVEVGNGTIDTYAEKIGEISGGGNGDYDQGYEDGKNSVVPCERYAKVIQFQNLNLFGKPEVELNLDNVTSLDYLASANDEENRNITVEHLTINCLKKITRMGYVLRHHYKFKDQTLKRLTLNFDTSNVTTFNYFVASCEALEVIDGTPLDFSSATYAANTFQFCNALVEIRFVKNSIKISQGFNSFSNLSDASIQSIIDGLADLTSGTAQTLGFPATVGNKLTEEQRAAITAKNWILVY